MSILIKGIDMPKDGKRTFQIYPNGNVVVMDTAWTQALSLKEAAVDVIEYPPRNEADRLSNADKFEEVFGMTVWESIDEGHGDWSSWLDAPYIAPEEK